MTPSTIYSANRRTNYSRTFIPSYIDDIKIKELDLSDEKLPTLLKEKDSDSKCEANSKKSENLDSR